MSEMGGEGHPPPFAVLLTVLLLSLSFPQRVRTTLSQVSVSLPLNTVAGLFLSFPLPLCDSQSKNTEARSRLVEVAHSPGFPVHEQDCWGACDQFSDLMRPGDVPLPLVASQRRSHKGNDGWLWCSKRDLNFT